MVADEAFERAAAAGEGGDFAAELVAAALGLGLFGAAGFDVEAQLAISSSSRLRRSLTDSKESLTWPRCRPRVWSSSRAVRTRRRGDRIRARGLQGGVSLGLSLRIWATRCRSCMPCAAGLLGLQLAAWTARRPRGRPAPAGGRRRGAGGLGGGVSRKARCDSCSPARVASWARAAASSSAPEARRAASSATRSVLAWVRAAMRSSSTADWLAVAACSRISPSSV